MYREDLDKVASEVNGVGPEDMIRFAAKCHPANGTTANWWPERGMLVVACAICDQPVVSIEAPSRPLRIVLEDPEIIQPESPQRLDGAARRNRRRVT